VKLRLVEAELHATDGQTDMIKLIFSLCRCTVHLDINVMFE